MLNRYTLPLISALVVSASLASCQRKEVVSVSELPPAGEIGFTVSDSDAETKSTPLKTADFGTNHSPFNVVVYSHAEGADTNDWELLSDAQICAYEESSGIWRPNTPIAWPMTEEKLTFIACAPTSLSPKTSSGDPLVDGEVPYLKNFTVNSDVAQQVDILLASEESSASPLVGNLNVGLVFHHALTFVKFSIGNNTTCSSITLSGIPGTGTLDMSTGEWSSVGTPTTYTITSPAFGSADANGQCLIDEDLTLMLIPQTLPSGATLTAEISTGTITSTITASLAGQVWEPGKVVTYKLTDPIPSFTVSATDKVEFSQGNLQAVFAAPGTSFTWKFADNQWDYVGNNAANTSIDGNGSVSAAGTVDMFGWSTSATKYGIHNSEEASAYYGEFVDWGSDPNLVSTLGSGWRTLSRAEWIWLLGPYGVNYPTPDPGENCRTSSMVSGIDNARFCNAIVNGVPGLVIFPDVYSHPSGVTVPHPDSVNASVMIHFIINNWSGDAWTKMSSAGCVFLPAAGSRHGTSVNGAGANGAGGYWSSTIKDGDDDWAHYLRFSDNGSIKPGNSGERSYAKSVRLVRDL